MQIVAPPIRRLHRLLVQTGTPHRAQTRVASPSHHWHSASSYGAVVVEPITVVGPLPIHVLTAATDLTSTIPLPRFGGGGGGAMGPADAFGGVMGATDPFCLSGWGETLVGAAANLPYFDCGSLPTILLALILSPIDPMGRT